MYADPNHLHDREIKLRLDAATYQLIDALAQFHRTQKAVLVRDLVEAALERLAAEDTHDQQVA
jgi:predicted DNA-binding protein